MCEKQISVQTYWYLLIHNVINVKLKQTKKSQWIIKYHPQQF